MDEVTAAQRSPGRVKAWFLDGAEIADSWRTFPRAMGAAYGYLVWDTWKWYTHLPSAERTVDVTTFTGAVFGMATIVAGLYLQGGRNWDRLQELKCSQK